MTADSRSSLETAIQAGIDAALKELHTCLPGEIVSFDPVEQTADIQLSIKRKQSGGLVNIPVLKEVPIRYLAGSTYTITFPLVEGDNVLVVFAERSIDTWLVNGGIQDPADIRKHSFSDAFAFPMMYSQSGKIANFDNDNMQIRTRDGSAEITIKANGDIELNGNGDTAVRFSDLKTAFDTLKSEFNAHTHPTAPAGPISTPSNAPSAADIDPAEVTTVKVP